MDTLETLARPAAVTRPQLRRLLPADLTAALLTDVPDFYATDTADVLRAALVVAVGDRGTVAARGGLAGTVSRLRAATDAAVIGFHYLAGDPELSAVVDVVVELVDGQIMSTWSWRAEARTERAVVQLSRAWSDALTALVAQARKISPIPDVLDLESPSISVDLPGSVSPDALRRAIDAVTCRYPYLATGRRVVNGVVFAVQGAGTSLRCASHDEFQRDGRFNADWSPMVQFDLTRVGAARNTLTITANPLLVGDLPGLAGELRTELAGDPDHVWPSTMDSARPGN
ncbi:hypothetical protein [Actinokineospora terrae]|uniref:Uncharacterized protein n=1 Tax=Actinokineospora terrae TaxID=155974 RepID=A0A1H9UBX0_9PSEU|nr:hypothetical protein [Actinokineospora terrae]SES06946.1 hypothetical protein SAMN04487818_107136 [Actinokineospora terrae]